VVTRELIFRLWQGVDAVSSDDLRILLLYLSQLYPDAPVYAVGCSLGANVLSKYCGEEPNTILKGAVVLSNPCVLFAVWLAKTNIEQMELLDRASGARKQLGGPSGLSSQ
jgi:predicted alpha/beta-fold hydrolase